MSIEIESVKTYAKSTCYISLSGTPEMKADLIDRQMQPYCVEIHYSYRQTATEGGWIEHSWHAVYVRVVGHRILNPGPDGAQRLGKATHKSSWYGHGTKGDVQDSGSRRPLPGWLDLIVSELRPSGDLTLVGGL